LASTCIPWTWEEGDGEEEGKRRVPWSWGEGEGEGEEEEGKRREPFGRPDMETKAGW
jgi:hypothetical protein